MLILSEVMLTDHIVKDTCHIATILINLDSFNIYPLKTYSLVFYLKLKTLILTSLFIYIIIIYTKTYGNFFDC